MNTSSSFAIGTRRPARRLAWALAAAGIFFSATEALAPAQALAQLAPDTQVTAQSGFADLVESVSPAVVSVRVEREMRARVHNFPQFNMPREFGLPEGHPMEEFFRRFYERHNERRGGHEGGPHRRVMGQGSGFFISEDGYVVTNHHVVKGGDAITVILHDGEEHEATLVGADAKTDLALLKVESGEPTPYVAFDEEDDLRVGDWVVAVGNPFGLGGTVTSGIVSGRGRDIGAGPYDDFIQIDAPINRGNSGGPTFDLRGRVVGVNAMIYSPSGGNVGIGFAIPASTAQDVIAELMEDGAVSRGWLGVRIQPVDKDIAASLGVDAEGGALVSEVLEGSPADAAGLRAGDVILSVDGEAIDQPRHLSRLIASLDADSQRRIRVWRGGSERTLTVSLGELPGEEGATANLDMEGEDGDLGLTLAPSEQGVQVVAIDPDSEAARKNIAPGDVILVIGTHRIASIEEFRTVLESARENGEQSILLLLRRGESQHYVALPAGQA